MKRIVLLLYLSICSLSIAQYVQKKPGQVWGTNEERYANLGDQAVSYIQNDMYSLAIDCINQMLSINCKNADRQKDYYSLIHCYARTYDYNKVIESCNKYIKISPENDPTLKEIYFWQGFAYAMSDNNNNAILCFERSISKSKTTDYKNLAQCHYLAARCYYLLDKTYLAETNYKKSIYYGCKEENVTIKQIETYGYNNFILGDMFYYYSRLKKGKSYNDWIYLLYLSAKCGHPEGLDVANEYSLFQWSSIPTPSPNLFQN